MKTLENNYNKHTKPRPKIVSHSSDIQRSKSSGLVGSSHGGGSEEVRCSGQPSADDGRHDGKWFGRSDEGGRPSRE